MIDPNGYYTLKEASEFLRLSLRKIFDLRREGRFVPEHPPKVRFKIIDLYNWNIDRHGQQPDDVQHDSERSSTDPSHNGRRLADGVKGPSKRPRAPR